MRDAQWHGQDYAPPCNSDLIFFFFFSVFFPYRSLVPSLMLCWSCAVGVSQSQSLPRDVIQPTKALISSNLVHYRLPSSERRKHFHCTRSIRIHQLQIPKRLQTQSTIVIKHYHHHHNKVRSVPFKKKKTLIASLSAGWIAHNQLTNLKVWGRSLKKKKEILLLLQSCFFVK